MTTTGTSLDALPVRRRSFVRLLELDPELAAGLSEEEARRAMKYLVARTTHVPAGSWEPEHEFLPEEPRSLGLLIVDGLLTRRVEVRGGSSLELLGPGDLIRPWDADRTPEDVMRTASWCALGATEVAWLDHEFAALCAHWPEVGANLLKRTMQRTCALACHLAISHIVGVELRILRLLGHLAERWGRVTRMGVLVPVPLTNEMIGTIIGARPPSVSTALRKLLRADLVVRRPDGTWLLHHQAVTGDAGRPELVADAAACGEADADASAVAALPV